MRNLDHEFLVQVQFSESNKYLLNELKSKILGTVWHIVDIPLKSVLKAEIIDFDIEL
jgi:hypothetical protein